MEDLNRKSGSDKSDEIRRRLHSVIPGGAHTYAKGDDQYPEHAPVLLKGKGCHVWDVEGNQYIEYGMGLRSVSLGHGFPPVVEAASRQMKLGCNFVRPTMLELEAAENLLNQIPGADMVKFAKNGSDATTAAVKLARAYTGKELVGICKSHPFFSVDDWFIGTTSINRGIPQSIINLTQYFEYNDIASVQSLFDQYPDSLACLIMEPEKDVALDPEFLSEIQHLCQQHGTLFIFDEMITGLRWHIGGVQTLMNVKPDLSTFGKALGNGFSVSALVGKREIMELGGLQHHSERVFLMSTTHGAEYHCLAAMMAVIKSYHELEVIYHLKSQGERLRAGFEKSIENNNLQEHVGIHGHPACLIYTTCDQDGNRSQIFRTLFMQELVKRGILAPNLVISYAHTDRVVDDTVELVDEALGIYRKALNHGVEQYLHSRPVQPVYRKWN